MGPLLSSASSVAAGEQANAAAFAWDRANAYYFLGIARLQRLREVSNWHRCLQLGV